MKEQIKSLLHTLAPKQFDALMAGRINRHGQNVMAKQGVPAIAAGFVERYGLTILGGLFVGMHYVSKSAGSSFLPKLIGSYECELFDVFNQIIATDYDTVVDVGCAEGFYVVGLAMRLQSAPKIYAFDTDPNAQALCHSLAQKNAVEEKITVAGHCDAKVLQATLQGRSLVICDCEGYETELLQPSATPALAAADILVELHDALKPGVTPIILERFQSSHNIQMIDSADRNPADYPVLFFLTLEQQKVAVSEFRGGPQQWAFMTPKN